jgi:hypothetical protein
MPKLLGKDKCPFEPNQVVKATRTFAWSGGVVHVGEEYRGGDPTVLANWSAFVDGGTLPSEMPNFWDEMPPPPEHRAPITIQTLTIAVHRQVRSVVDAFFPGHWAEAAPAPRAARCRPSARRSSAGRSSTSPTRSCVCIPIGSSGRSGT